MEGKIWNDETCDFNNILLKWNLSTESLFKINPSLMLTEDQLTSF